MKVIYEAKDGTQFDLEEECRKYEKRHCALLDRHSFFASDADGNYVPADDYGYSPDDFDYFCCFTKEGVKACEDFFYENCIHRDFTLEPNKVYHYNYNKEEWRPLSEQLEYLSHELNRLSAIEQKILSAKQS